jgi:hypothetical protein
MMEAFRCIHASRLLLDHQLHGLQLPAAAALVRNLRDVIEEATLNSFEQIVESCLVHEVNCLLLSGECFDPDDRGLRGPAALVRGIERLEEHDIPVVLQSSATQWSHWPAGLRIPASAHRLGTGFVSSVALARRGKLIATIAEAEPSAHPSAAGRGWQITIPEKAAADGTVNSRIVQLFDDPKPAQGVRPHETGSRGCTLIEFDDRGNHRQSFLATAPVRWERFDLAVSAGTTRDDLLQEMASILEQTGSEPCERVWLVGWNLSGEGPLLETLADKAAREDLCAELAELEPVPNVLVHTHGVRVHLPVLAARLVADRDELAVEYAARLAERFGRPETGLHESLAASALHGGPWEVKLATLFAELDAGEVAQDAARMAMQWFAAHEELSS